MTYGNNSYKSLRPAERLVYFENCSSLSSISQSNYGCYALFDNQDVSRNQAILNIIKTSFICILLILGSYGFHNQIKRHIIKPIKIIIEKIKIITVNPAEAMHKIEAEEIRKINKAIEKRKSCCFQRKIVPPYEAIMLDQTVTKIGDLLSLGLGECGSQLIRNTQSNNNIEDSIFISGSKIMAIYCLCDVKNFTDKLENFHNNEIEVFNAITEIIHTYLSNNHEMLSKNVGDSFFLVSKLSDNLVIIFSNSDSPKSTLAV